MAASSDVAPVEMIRQLLSHSGITQVICVDDEYASSPAVEEVIALCSSCSPEDAKAVLADLDVTVDDEDIMAADLRKLWTTTGFGDEQKKALHKKFKAIAPDNGKVDTKAASMLSRVIGEQALAEISFQEWNSRKQLILKSRRRGKTLLLFDLDMSGDGGNTESGIELIREVLTKTRNRFTCCLLSHTISSKGEPKAWTDLSKRHLLDRDRFFPISKSRLQDEKDLSGFVDGIRRVVLNPQMKQLKKAVAGVIQEAHSNALEAVEKVDILDLEKIVFESSLEEGVWEPDTLFRLFGLYHRLNARKTYLADADLHALASKVRTLSTMIPNHLPGQSQTAWHIQNLELYEDPELVNRSHLPIELGDIFEKPSNGKRYILLAQPCDLMVRSNGSRHHTVNECIIAEIIKDPTASGETLARLQFYDSPDHEWFVQLRKTHTVALSVLDLCVLQPDGIARICANDDCPKWLIPSWQKHHLKLREYYAKLVSKHEALFRDIPGRKQEIEKATLRSSVDGLFKGTVDIANKAVTYDCKRIGRLCRSHSQALLTRYAHHIARTAFEPYFDRDRK